MNEPDELRDRFNDDLKRATAYMEPIHQRMDRDYEWYRNYKNGQDRGEPMTVSQLYEYVETVTPIVTNNRIRANVYSEYPEYVTHAKGINDILDHTYDVNNWDYKSQEIMRQALISRSALAYTGYDKAYKNKTGKLCAEQCNIRWAYFDPGAVCFEDSGFFFYVEPKRKSEVIALHPDKKEEIKKISGDPKDYADKGNNWFKTFLESVKQKISFVNGNTGERRSAYDSVQSEMVDAQRYANSLAYIHYWYRDDEDKWRIAKYADKTFLKDEPNPFWHEQLPYDLYSPIKDPRSMLGIPIGEQLGGVDLQRNQILDYLVECARLNAHPPLLYNTTFGNVKDPRKLKQEADEGLIAVNNPDMVDLRAIAQYMVTPSLDGNAVQMPERLEAMMDKVTGVNDSFRGMSEATSGKEVQLKQEASYTRIKTMIDQFELFNKRVAEKTIVNAMQFYTQSRGFRIKGDYTRYDTDAAMMAQEGQEMPFEVKPIAKGIGEQGEPVMSRTEFFLYANPNEWTKVTEDIPFEGGEGNEGEGNEKEGKDANGQSGSDDSEARGVQPSEKEEVEKAYKILSFTVEIEAGSSLPQSRLARREEASELFQMQAIDQEALLDAYDWPDREEIIKRMQEKQAEAAQMQAQQAQAEAQGKVQAEQVKAQTQIQLKQMELQGQAMQTEANNAAKMEQQKAEGRSELAEQSMENTGNGLAEILDQIRQQHPETEQMSDEELIQALSQ